MVAVGIMGVMVIGASGVIAVHYLGEAYTEHNQRRQARLQAWGQSHGLTPSGRSFVGEVQGKPTVVKQLMDNSNNSAHQVAVSMEMPHPVGRALTFGRQTLGHDLLAMAGAKDLEVGDAELDRRVRIHGSPETARTILTDPDVRDALLGLLKHNLTMDGTTLTAKHQGAVGDKTTAILTDLGHLAAVIELARTRAWREAAARHGLRVATDVNTLEGAVGAGQITVNYCDMDSGTGTTEIRLTFRERLPAGTQIRSEGTGLSLGDPVLDSAIAVQGDGARLAELLCRDGAREAVMAVIHGYPMSEVTETQIVLRAEGRLGNALGQAIDDVAELAKYLSPTSLRGRQAQAVKT